MPRFYLDTSVQIERHGGEARRRGELKELLRSGGHATSSQVLREWNSIVLGACSELLSALAVAESREDVVARLRKGFGRKPSHRWMVTEWLLGVDTDLRIVEMRARRFLRVGSKAWLKAGIEKIRDGTDCPIARRRAVQDPKSGKWSHNGRCKKTEDICSQHAFLAAHSERAKAAAQALQNSPRPQDRRMGAQASGILSMMPSNDSKGQACWGADGLGGDICIALECAPTALVALSPRLLHDEALDEEQPLAMLQRETRLHLGPAGSAGLDDDRAYCNPAGDDVTQRKVGAPRGAPGQNCDSRAPWWVIRSAKAACSFG